MELYQICNEDKNRYPVIITIPHSGRYIPAKIRKQFISQITLPNMDWYLDVLYSFLEPMEATMIMANYSRYVIDLNRGLHLKSGIGNYTETLIYDKTTFGKNIYKKPLQEEDIADRIEKYYLPYYAKLKELIFDKLKVFEKVYLLDLHSFYQQSETDVCLGTVGGTTALDNTLSLIKNNLLLEGFSVDENNVFLGGNCIRHLHSKFANRIECVAIELRYTTYLGNRYFGEEEITSWDNELFLLTQGRLKIALQRIFAQWKI